MYIFIIVHYIDCLFVAGLSHLWYVCWGVEAQAPDIHPHCCIYCSSLYSTCAGAWRLRHQTFTLTAVYTAAHCTVCVLGRGGSGTRHSPSLIHPHCCIYCSSLYSMCADAGRAPSFFSTLDSSLSPTFMQLVMMKMGERVQRENISGKDTNRMLQLVPDTRTVI